MRGMCTNRGVWALAITAIGAMGVVRVANAEVTTEQAGSIVVWPKVIWDGTRDTIIQVANTGNAMAHAHCFYINGAPVNPNLPPSATNPPQWVETDFEIWLTRQQPTHWVASIGRQTAQVDQFGSDGAGFDPGLVPPVPQGFKGELECVQIDDSGAPMAANKLEGEATLQNLNGDVSKYNALTFTGNATLAGSAIGNNLTFNLTDANPNGEYSACPNTLILDFIAEGASDPVVSALGTCAGGNTCPVSTSLTLVPCRQDLENGQGSKVEANFDIWNEMEDHFSSHVSVNCWSEQSLGQISGSFAIGTLGTLTGHARLTPAPGEPGLVGVAEEVRRDTNTAAGAGATVAFNLNGEGNRFDAAGVTDTIVIPGE